MITKILTTIWVMQKKTNGTYRTTLNVVVSDLSISQHYFNNNIVTQVISDITTYLIFVVLLLIWRKDELLDIKGAAPKEEWMIQ